MIRYAERKVNPDRVKRKVSFLHVIYLTCFFLSLFLFAFTWAYGAVPEKHFFISAEAVFIAMIIQAALFLTGMALFIYTDKLKIVFKIDLYKPQKNGESRAQQLRSYRKHFKKRLTSFIIFEFFLIAFFVTSLIVTRIIGRSINNCIIDPNNFFNSEMIFLIYTIVSLVAMALDIMYVNYLIQLSSKIFKKKPVKNGFDFDQYDYD
ncbi:MAG TPA: hypothetical protein VIL23_00645 [Clostridia bacterium]